MGFQDRQYRTPGAGGGGGFGRAVRRAFGGSNDFFSWSLPLFTFRGIRVRIHLLFVIFIVIELIRAMEHGAVGVTYRAIAMAGLFILVLVHEFGHCFACRWVGGEADDILMWPLGGLAMCNPPHHPRAALITTLGGPATHLVMGPVLAGLLLLAGAPTDALFFRPLDPYASIGALGATSNLALYTQVGLFLMYVMNAYLFLFNMLLPMFPMDAGRVVQEVLWFRLGYRRSMRIAVNLGFYLAIIIGFVALTRGVPMLFSIAFFAGFTCWQERQRLNLMEPDFHHGYDFSRGHAGMPGGGAGRSGGRSGGGGGATVKVKTGPTKSDLKRKQEEAETLAEVDRILEKIRTEGMGSLTKKEKDVLKGETERKRREAAGE